MGKLYTRRWAISLWIVVLFTLAMAPLQVKTYLHTIGRWHSAGHCVAFFITALLLLWDARSLRSEFLRFGTVLALAFLMEVLENLVYHAGFEWHDILFDLTGIISAWVLTSVIRSDRTEPITVSQQATKIQ